MAERACKKSHPGRVGPGAANDQLGNPAVHRGSGLGPGSADVLRADPLDFDSSCRTHFVIVGPALEIQLGLLMGPALAVLVGLLVGKARTIRLRLPIDPASRSS